ncbi:HAD hydrolase-like protein [Rhodobacterales bacterium HKCCE4037]|nr:HAD hydrolase-like protein [Rhodobacterales bacterium HKCCE4037]
MTLEGVIFAGMGTIADCAEIDRRAWNAAFRAHGVNWNWSWDTYAELMRVGGDRQLVESFAAWRGEACPVDAETLDNTHQKRFASVLTDRVPLRPGVARTISWLARAGVSLGFVSRSGDQPVRALLSATARERSGIGFDVAVLRSDVTHLAPDPEGVTRAIEGLSLGREHIVAIADTPASAKAAQDAGLAVLAFPGALASDSPEDFGTLPMARVLSPEILTAAWRGPMNAAAE